MKYFSCQPDSHNAFVSLTNCTLAYFTVDCPRYETYAGTFAPAAGQGPRLSAVPGSSAVPLHGAGRPAGGPLSATLAGAVPAPTQETKVHVQHVVLLPDSFRAQSSCFGMANRSLFGTELAFVGTSKGLLALVVLSEKSVVFAPGKDPDSVHEAERQQRLHQQQGRGTAYLSAVAASASAAAAGPVGGAGAASSGSYRPAAGDDGRCGGGEAPAAHGRASPGIGGGEEGVSDASVGGLGSSFSTSAVDSAVEEGVHGDGSRSGGGGGGCGGGDPGECSSEPSFDSSYPSIFTPHHHHKNHHHHHHNSNHHPHSSHSGTSSREPRGRGVGGPAQGPRRRGPARREAPSTITWARDRPLTLVGYTSGRVEWYCVRVTPARQQQLAELGLGGAAIPVRGLAHHVSDPHTAAAARVTSTTMHGRGDGIVVELVASFVLPDSGALVTSDYCPANGGIVLGGERCIVLLSPEQLTAPLCRLSNFGCSFLYCHPFLPLVGTLSWGWSTIGPCYFLASAAGVGDRDDLAPSSQPAPGAARRVFVGNPNGYGGGCLLNILELVDSGAAGPSDGAAGAPRRTGRKAAAAGEAALSVDPGLGMPSTQAAPSGGLHGGPTASAATAPKASAAAGKATRSPVRFRHVQQRLIASHTPRYGASFSFSWKFSFDLELGVCNVEEGLVHIIRLRHRTSPAGGSYGRAEAALAAPSPSTATTPWAPSFPYEFTHEHRLRLPLHSLVNVEYVSAATAVLATPAVTTPAEAPAPVVYADPRGSSGGAATAPQRFSVRFRAQESLSHSARLAGAGPRPLNGWGGALHDPLGGPGGGMRWPGVGLAGAPAATHLALSQTRLDEAHGGGGGGGGVGRGLRRTHGSVTLRENMLAAELLQPLSGGNGRRRRRRRHPSAGGSRGPHQRGGASTSTAAGAGGGAARSVPIPSATGGALGVSVGEELQDLRTLLRIGPGATSSIVGMSLAGEVTSIPVEMEAIATWHEEGSVFVGLSSTICAADLVTIQGIERQMKRRMESGFRLSPEENVRALAAVSRAGPGRRYAGVSNECSTLAIGDLSVMFTLISALTRAGMVGPVGDVPSMCQLLLRHALSGEEVERAAAHLDACASTALPRPVWLLREQQLRRPRASTNASPPSATELLRGTVRLLLLHILHWLPPTVSEANGCQVTAAGEDDGGAPELCEDSGEQEVERAVAVQVLHGRLAAGAAILRRFGDRHPSYCTMANLILGYDRTLRALHASDTHVWETFLSSLSPWLLAVFVSLSADSEDSQSYRARIYENSLLPLWDRVAIALTLERDTERLLLTLHDTLLRDCTLLQALTLVHGVSAATYPIMQEIVDGTGDFQLGACLYARIGVLSPHFPSLYPRAGAAHSPWAAPASTAAEDECSHSGWALSVPSAAGTLSRVVSPTIRARPAPPAVVVLPRPASPPTTLGPAGLPSSLARATAGAPARALLHCVPPPPSAPLVLSPPSREGRARALLEGSVLPPPPLVLPAMMASPTGAAPAPAPTPAVCGREVGSDIPEVAPAVARDHPSLRSFSTDAVGEVGEDCPWVWWASAYRAFLDSEQAFVERTMFDVACQRLREEGLAAMAAGEVGGASVSVPPPPLVRGLGEDGGGEGGGGGPPSSWLAPATPICRRDGMPEAALMAKTAAAQAQAAAHSPGTAAPAHPSALITPEQHRLLLGALSNREPRCSVCLEPVKVHRRESSHSLAWCTACQHGGHADHLREWFAHHRQCPVYGCRCRCDEDASLY